MTPWARERRGEAAGGAGGELRSPAAGGPRRPPAQRPGNAPGTGGDGSERPNTAAS